MALVDLLPYTFQVNTKTTSFRSELDPTKLDRVNRPNAWLNYNGLYTRRSRHYMRPAALRRSMFHSHLALFQQQLNF